VNRLAGGRLTDIAVLVLGSDSIEASSLTAHPSGLVVRRLLAEIIILTIIEVF
jgi:hypothetical protein